MKTSFILRSLVLTALIGLSSCSNDDNGNASPEIPSGNFVVTIENTFETKQYFVNGTIGFIAPGNTESYTFNAGKGHYLNFATLVE